MNISPRLFSSTITVEPYLGTDGYSNEIYGVPVMYKAREENRVEEAQLDNGQTLMQRCRVFVYGNANIHVRDRVTLSDGEIFPVLQIYKQRGPGITTDFVEMIVGRAPGGV